MSKAPTQQLLPHSIAIMVGWRRVMVTLLAAIALSTMLLPIWRSDAPSLFVRVSGASLVAMIAFGLFERSPSRLPRWLARWVLQVLGVALAVPLSLFLFWVASTEPGQPAFWLERERLGGFAIVCVAGLLLAPWVALGALVRQKEAIARHQALAFELERSELSRQALDARLRLLQAQVEPHFLFNTLANVRALVESRSPKAPQVLDSLISYLRAAVPRLHHSGNSFRDELALVRAYLELMHMRMPDRLQYTITCDPAALSIACPPTTLLTLVENAIRHGIDPSEIGGRIEVDIGFHEGCCIAKVLDTGLGFNENNHGCGTGLASLQERLQLSYGDAASLHMSPNVPHGVIATVSLPATREGFHD